MKKYIFLTLIALLSYGTSLATIKYVTTSGSGSQDGSSWTNASASSSLKTVLDGSSVGDTIWVANGTYKPGVFRNDYFEIKDGVKVFGGFVGTEPVGYNLALRDFAVNETILSGDIGTSGQSSDNSYHVVYTQNVSSATLVDGFTIQDGNANSSSFPNDRGGAWYNKGRFSGNSSNPTISNVIFKNNAALLKGGALCNDGYEGDASPILTNCSFLNNSSNDSTGKGGAIYNEGLAGNSNPSFTNCLFYNNTAYQGGGVFNDGNAQSQGGHSNPTFSNCTFYNNGRTSNLFGEAIFSESANSGSEVGESTTNLRNTILWGENAFYKSFSIVGSSKAELYASLVREIDCAALNTGGLATFHGNGNLFAQNPEFVDSTNGNLQLQTIGAAYNAGDNSIVIEVFDINNGLRIRDTQVDMGAYEYDDIPIKVYVDASKTTGDFKGYSWANAFTDLQDALSYSKAADAIWVAAGTYKPTSTLDRIISFVIPDSVKVYGGFAGNEATNYNLDLRDFTAYETILSGDIGSPADSTDNSYHVVYTQNVSHETVVDGITITRGNANGTTFLLRIGGAWFNDGSGSGNSSSPTLTNCTFASNTAGRSGGAMYNEGSNGTSNPTLTNCTFTSNTAGGIGGAMYNDGINGVSSPVLTNCIFASNTAFEGGAIYNDGFSGTSSPTLASCTFTSNTANSNGGAMYNDGENGTSNPTSTNCTFDSNSASFGGAMFNNGNEGITNLSLTNCTFTSNTASDNGGAMYNNGNISGTSNPTLTNCILWGNMANTTPNSFYNRIGTGGNATVTISHSLVQETSCNTLNVGTGNVICFGTMIFNLDPQFINASNLAGADNVLGTADDGLRLQNSSPAIDQGSNASITHIEDITGQKHINAPDMGAYENPCSKIQIITTVPTINNGEYTSKAAIQTLEAANIINNTSNVYYQAGKSILLSPGFIVAPAGNALTVFEAVIGDGCP